VRNILCFGDSNTWGYVPGTGERFDNETRWTALTSQMLNNEFTLYEAGLSGRTVNSDDPERAYRNGAKLLNLYLESCRPLDLVIIMLGTNDLKASLENSMETIKNHAKQLCQQVLDFDYSPYKAPQLMLVAPVPFAETAELDEEFVLTLAASRQIAPAYYRLAQELNVKFLDAGRVIKASQVDGIHWDADGHRDFAHHLAAILKQLW